MATKIFTSTNRTLIAAGILGTAIFLYWRINSVDEGSLGVWEFFISSLIFSGATFLLWYQSYKSQRDISLFVVVLFAVVFRTLGVGAFPILEDDVYRFLWDGKQTIELGTPYGESPTEYFDDERLSDQWHEILGAINHPEVATVYGPVAQYSFALAYVLAPGEVWALQLIIAAFDLLLILVLSRLSLARNLLLYAWSPLIVKEFAFSAHPDVIGAFFLVFGIALLRSKKTWLAGISFAAALGVKVIAIVAIPILICFNWRAWTAMLLAMVLLALPFGLQESWFPAGLSEMSQAWVFNAPLHLLFIDFESYASIKVLLIVMLALSLASLFVKELKSRNDVCSEDTIDRAILAFAFLFMFSPVVNAWYLVWMLALSAIRPKPWIWLASAAVLLSYFSGINLPESSLALYQQPLWLVWIEFGLVIVCYLITKPRKN